MANLPKHIKDAIHVNDTSLGTNDAIPPSDENSFLYHIVDEKFKSLAKEFSTDNKEEIQNVLTDLITQCINIESRNVKAIMDVCVSVVTDMFFIPQDAIQVDISLTTNITPSKMREEPEPTPDFSFDSIADMEEMTREVYKRRMINALVVGASESIGWDIGSYADRVYRIDPELLSLYSKIKKCNEFLLYLENDKDYFKGMPAGDVDIFLYAAPQRPKVKAQGVILPVLLAQTVKGLLSIAVAHGLPKKKEQADYVIKKADFRNAELWDLRLGVPLWERMVNAVDKSAASLGKVGADYLLMSLSEEPTDVFNEMMKEIFLGTKKGVEYLSDVCGDIIDSRNAEFCNYLQRDSDKININDDDSFTSEELKIDMPILG